MPKEVTFYRTYGCKKGVMWELPVRVWVHKPRRFIEGALARAAEIGMEKLLGNGELSDAEKERFRSRIADSLADDDSREEVFVTFDGDPKGETFQLTNAEGSSVRTDANGLVEGVLRLSEERAQILLQRQHSSHGWLSCHARVDSSQAEGRIRLIPPQGLSVVSDIDDTIKITEIPAGKEIVLRNTFFREFVAAPEMAERYRELGNEVAFHYVSGGPWQMYEVLAQFLFGERFPEGTFHMKNVRKNLLEPETWKDLWTLFINGSEEATVNQKIQQISQLMTDFPQRQFVLIGDFGEKDPEVFRRSQEQFPTRVQEIRIRDVVNDRAQNQQRLAGMTIIEAETIIEGVSQLR